MTRMIIVLCALAAVAYAAPIEESTPIPIVKSAAEGPNPDGSYKYSYETGNGIQVSEEGHLNNQGTDEEALEATGEFTYTDPEGTVYHVSYVANGNGFQPSGDHLPTTPPTPPAILKALEYIAAHPNEYNDNE